MTNDILPWTSTGYIWIERQDGAEPLKWVSLQQPAYAQNGDQPTATIAPAAPAQ